MGFGKMYRFYVLLSFLNLARGQKASPTTNSLNNTSQATEKAIPTTYTLYNTSQATQITWTSSTISGHLAIASGFSGAVDLDGIEAILGDLRCEGAEGVTKIVGRSLMYINGTMSLDRMPGLSSLAFRELTSLGGIFWKALPAFTKAESNKQITHAPSISVYGAMLSSLDFVQPAAIDELYVGGNSFLDTLSFPTTLISQEATIMIEGGRLPLYLDIGNVSKAEYIGLGGNFSRVKGFENLRDVNYFDFDTYEDFDCSQFSSIKFGNISCSAGNSSYFVIKNYNGTIKGIDWRDPPLSLSTKLWIGLMVSLPVTLILFLAFLRFMDLRQSKKHAANQHPGIPELALGGHHEKAELAVVEIPVELTEIPDVVHELPNSMSANIIDVREMDIQPVGPVGKVEEVTVEQK